ncbi:MAG: TonB-dependent receptor [Bacteroidota bacterium]
MKQINYIICLLLFLPALVFSQSKSRIEGKVVEEIADGTQQPLIGANVYWLNTEEGTTTNEEGYFKLKRSKATNQLVVSYIGYKTDTLEINTLDAVKIIMTSNVTIDGIEVVSRKKSSSISFLEPIKLEQIGETELLKAACCNLSESFETSPSVDVSFTDAITGTRQLQMLGLSGPYIQINRENIPHIRGLAANIGLTYVPGTWIEGMQLNKGTGSVANGFESIAGQINVELRKPETADRLYLNGFVNQIGRTEGNLNLARKLSNRWSTALLLHTTINQGVRDRNEDSFLDIPNTNRYIALNRWQYNGPNKLRVQFGVKATVTDQLGGQVGFDPDNDLTSNNLWGFNSDVTRLEAWSKIGLVYPEAPWKTMGLQLSIMNHDNTSSYGNNIYNANQTTFYANYLYQSTFSNTNHSFRTGASFLYDNFDENLNNQIFDREEIVPGAFAEYTYNYFDEIGVVLGLRVDHHNLYGAFVTPRAHFRYAANDDWVFRASIGRGLRTANVIAENIGYLATARNLVIESEDSSLPYGLDPEIAWNYGFNVTHTFRWDYREGSVSLDFYRTDFQNQIVVDLDQDPQSVFFYNLDGQSYSNSFQIQFDYEVLKFLDMRLAYRWFDVKTTYNGQLLQKPLLSAHRAFLNLGYESRNYWKFDATFNWQGEKRIPFTGSNPEAFQLDERSPDFVLMNAQISKQWAEKFEIYVGAENLLDFRQNNPILSSDDPNSPFFDSSLVWGPIFGRNIYAGFRYKLK